MHAGQLFHTGSSHVTGALYNPAPEHPGPTYLLPGLLVLCVECAGVQIRGVRGTTHGARPERREDLNLREFALGLVPAPATGEVNRGR
jgi:hypothetical protein